MPQEQQQQREQQRTDSLGVRAIEPPELHTFTLVPRAREDAARHAELTEHLSERWASGASRPGWCFVAEEGGEIVGRIGYWARPRVSPEARYINPLLFDLPWSGDHQRIGSRLLAESLAALRDGGAKIADLGVDCPTDFEPIAARCVGELLTGSGWEVTRETLRFDFTPRVGQNGATPGSAMGLGRLTYRSIEEVGDDAYVEAIGAALVGTLDRPTRREIEREGTGGKARGTIAFPRALVRDAGWRVDPGWWRLGYTADGALAGFVMPAVNASGDGVIWWIGVVPEQRGHRYVDELLGVLVETLAGAGVRRIVADTDTENRPMARAFARCGFRQFATSTTYKLSLV